MKVILVNPRIYDVPNHPLGILYIAGYLEKNGFEVEVIDPNFDESAIEIAKKIISLNPDVVGISTRTPQIDHAKNIASHLKLSSDIPIVFGGPHPTVLPQEVLKENCIDFVAIGEGEITFSELCEALKENKGFKDVNGIGYKKNGELIFTESRELIPDLDSIPFPARHLLPSKWYFAPPRIRGIWTKSTATIMASRGCPYRCIFCGSHRIFGRKTRFRSPENIIEELKHLRNKYHIDAVWFADDTFTLHPAWVTKLCSLIKQQGWNDFKWVAQARVNTVSYELLKTMKSAGCVQIDFGVESGSPKVLKILKKDITPEKVIEAFNIAKKAGLLRYTSFIIGTPGEKEEDLRLTFKLLKKIKPDYVDFYFMTPYPGTEVYQIAKELGVFEKGVSFNKWLLGKHSDKPVMCTDLSEKKIIEWRSKLYNASFIRNYKTLMRNPSFIFGGLMIAFKGIGGLRKGLGRFFKTGKIDSIFVELLVNYRMKTKKQFYK